MKVSVVTVCYNSADTIEDTIKSVANQKNVDVEHIIVDGLSTDDTARIVRQYNSVSKFVSEKDSGLYDAMNKGIALASGDVIGTLNSDDFYVDESVLYEVSKVFLDPTVDACYGDLVYVQQSDTSKVVRYWKSCSYENGLFKSGWMPAHPTFFARKAVYERLGGFNLSYKIAADFELLFRFIEQNKIRVKYIPSVLVKMRVGGVTNRNLSNVLLQNSEIVSILKREYQNFSLSRFLFLKALNRIEQFVSRP